MCLNTKSIPYEDVPEEELRRRLVHKEKKVAEEDIVVYKILNAYTEGSSADKIEIVYLSPYKNYEWQPGREEATLRLTVKCNLYEDTGTAVLSILDGLHAYTNIPDALTWKVKINTVVASMVIPKGSTYYTSFDESQIVSDCMVWDGRVVYSFQQTVTLMAAYHYGKEIKRKPKKD